ncbi:unnamed protein product [Diamesa tonsa]
MCFITYWTGCSTEEGFPPQALPSSIKRKKKIVRKDLISEYYEVLPIHKRPDLIDESINLINNEWPRSRCQRLWSLGSSKDDLPCSLIVTFKQKDNVADEPVKKSEKQERQFINDIFFNQQLIDTPQCKNGKTVNVLGHLRLLPVPSDDKACFIESMVISKDFRGKGIGSFFIGEAQRFCEEELKLKSIYLTTFDSGEFYMKIGFKITPGISIFGGGEVNTVSKKIFLKKELNYIEPEEPEEPMEEAYDANKDNNYRQQKQIENDVILSGFPFKTDHNKPIVERLCQLYGFPTSLVKYYYSFEEVNRETCQRSFHLMISLSTLEARLEFQKKSSLFGVLCFQDFFEKPVDQCDNLLINCEQRLTRLNVLIRKELKILSEERWISDYKFMDYNYYAKQNDLWIAVKNLGIIELLKIQEEPDVPDEDYGWEVTEEEDLEAKALEKFRSHFKKQLDSWLPKRCLETNVITAPIQTSIPASNEEYSKELNSLKKDDNEPSWVEKIESSKQVIMIGLNSHPDDC